MDSMKFIRALGLVTLLGILAASCAEDSSPMPPLHITPTVQPSPTPPASLPTPIMIPNGQPEFNWFEKVAQYGEGSIHDFALNPDGNTLAVSGNLGIRLFEYPSMQLVGQLHGEKGMIWELAWSPDGQWLAGEEKGGQIIIWDMATKAVHNSFKSTGGIKDTAWSPSGKQIALIGSLNDNQVYILDAITGGLLRAFGLPDYGYTLAWSPDGSLLAGTTIGGDVLLWDMAAGRTLHEWGRLTKGDALTALNINGQAGLLTNISWGYLGQPAGGIGEVSTRFLVLSDIAWSPDGRQLATCDKNDVLIYDPYSGIVEKRLPGKANYGCTLAWSPDGSRLASESREEITIWDTVTWEALGEYEFDGQWIHDMVWAPDGQEILFQGKSNHGDTVNDYYGMWRWQRHNQRISPITAVQTYSIKRSLWLAGSHTLVSLQNNGFFFTWDLDKNEQIFKFAGPAVRDTDSVALSPDASRIAVLENSTQIAIWDVASGKRLKILAGHTEEIRVFVWSPDSALIASSSADKTLRVWDVRTGRMLAQMKEGPGKVGRVLWSPGGDRLASMRGSGKVRVWDTTTWQNVLLVHAKKDVSGYKDFYPKFVWSPDGKHLAVENNYRIEIWDIENGKLLLTLAGHQGQLTKLAWSPDGKWLATDANAMNIWNASTGELVRSLPLGSGFKWSPDSKYIAGPSGRYQIMLWETENWQGAQKLSELSSVILTVIWSADSRYLAVTCEDGTIHVWRATESTP